MRFFLRFQFLAEFGLYRTTVGGEAPPQNSVPRNRGRLSQRAPRLALNLLRIFQTVQSRTIKVAHSAIRIKLLTAVWAVRVIRTNFAMSERDRARTGINVKFSDEELRTCPFSESIKTQRLDAKAIHSYWFHQIFISLFAYYIDDLLYKAASMFQFLKVYSVTVFHVTCRC